MGTDLSKLRRFALAIGVILFFYAIAGVRVVDYVSITPFGISLEIDQPRVLEWALAMVSIYATLRYWYYGFIAVASPSEVRGHLRKGKLPPIGSTSHARDLVRRYLPGLDEGKAEYVIKEHTQQGWIVHVSVDKLPYKTRILAGLDFLDYTAPIWVNGMAIMMFFVSRASNG